MIEDHRLSRVDSLYLNTVGLAAVAQLGDHETAILQARTIALQRAISDFEGDEVRYASYSLFSRPNLELRAEPDGILTSRSPGADIRVGSIQAINVVAASLVRIGCSESLTAESRTKHIRQFNDPDTGVSRGR